MSSPNPSAKNQALQDVIANLTTCFQSLQRQGMNLGSVSKKGNSFWGMLKQIHEHGPLTVPQIALRRRVSRQRIQVMVDEYVADGYLKFVDNPSHKRSRLVTLTKTGQTELAQMSAIIFNHVEQAAGEFQKEELQTTVKVLQKLQQLMEQA